MQDARLIHVKGIVQGVGFRPFVYRLAKRYLISGWVKNTAEGVFIHAQGDEKLMSEFIMELADNAPAAARVDEIKLKEVPLEDFDGFEIRASGEEEPEETTLVSADLATCPECVAELFSPNDRRYRYPFINCTNCGPRFTIIDELPYDRARTSMADFPMCDACAAEYTDPENRRFHAQPDACFDCGPMLSFYQVGEDEEPSWARTREESDAIIARTVALLQAGGIVAVKGLGGFHLVCDAENPDALARLRARKKRSGKAFAVMVADVETARRYCHVDDAEAEILSGSVRPIVLLRKRADVELTKGLADRLPELGVMLPYTPLQHLLMYDFVGAGGSMLVMTSGNFGDEPIVISDEQARTSLGAIADAVLGNNREIRARYDDSVVRMLHFPDFEALQVVRRARGYAPVPLRVAAGGEGAAPSILAVGPEQKNTFTLLTGAREAANEGQVRAFVSQHIGDMEHADTYDAWLECLARYKGLFQVEPATLAADMHPEYLTSKWADEQTLPVTRVQHHHAHIAAVMEENGLADAVCGIAFDGTGYGADGAIWGGEVLLANKADYERFANLSYVPMPGGAAAVKDPLRMAYGVLWAFDLLEHPAAKVLLDALGDTVGVLDQMIEQGINTPYTSSMGRLFDAASALLGVCTQATYEGEPAILLEAVISAQGAEADEAGLESDERYAFEFVKNTATSESTAHDTSVLLMDAEPVFRAMLDDMAAGIPAPVIARRFHNAVVDLIVRIADIVRAAYDISTVVLAGGVFMNRYLIEHAVDRLAQVGFTVALNKDLPPNDGSVSFGQAVVAYNASEQDE